jgi:hypothetical protein
VGMAAFVKLIIAIEQCFLEKIAAGELIFTMSTLMPFFN